MSNIYFVFLIVFDKGGFRGVGRILVVLRDICKYLL